MVPGLAAVHADPLGVAVAFGAGMLSFLSPCVLPLVPGYLSMVSGLSAAELNAARRSRQAQAAPAGVGAPVPALVGGPALTALRPDGVEDPRPSQQPAPGARSARRLGRLLSFVAGFTVVFVALGASASAVGRLLLTHQHALEVASGVVVVAFGSLLLATAAGLPVPPLLLSERRLPVRPSLLGSLAPPVMGMAFAFAWTPCIGPVLGSVLALAAGTGGSVLGGVVLLTAYSLGLGVPF
ncbi:MAG TPA: cytochrome c biogenesis protein CcdA, partial [Acidimicrobiales bacterium]|nr:cytochrome c biogenesis protein CcdA [Acidimicrobiales bacterium]